MGDRRSAGQAKSCAQFGGDDHGQGGLAQTGRAAEQDVVGDVLTLFRGRQDQPQLVLDAFLTDEVT